MDLFCIHSSIKVSTFDTKRDSDFRSKNNYCELLRVFVQFDWINGTKLAIVATENKKRRCSPSPSPSRRSSTAEGRISEPSSLPPVSSHFNGIMPPSAPFLTWSPILLPPWGSALFPAALYPAAFRSLPGFVQVSRTNKKTNNTFCVGIEVCAKRIKPVHRSTVQLKYLKFQFWRLQEK